jgi:23S rRNA pseudouridine2457 synthase
MERGKPSGLQYISALGQAKFPMARIILFNKPFRVLSQFRASGDKVTLSHYFDDPALRVAGRLDYESEGLMLLSDSGRLVQKITHPRYKLEKIYLAQVEGEPSGQALEQLRNGVLLKDGKTRPAQARRADEPEQLWPRDPPIRFRAAIPVHWLELTISEGRNRQVRRMTAAVGFPTLRLIRIQVGEWSVEGLAPGEWTEMS